MSRPLPMPAAGKYPLARFLYLYVNKAPGKPLPPLVAEFLKYVYSKAGQHIVIKDGYFPLPQTLISQEIWRNAIGLHTP